MVRRLTREEMLSFVSNILNPSMDSSQDEVDEQLNIVCMNAPDPVAAYDIIVETPPPTTAEALVEAILILPPRDPRTLPESELAANDPFRTMKLDPLR